MKRAIIIASVVLWGTIPVNSSEAKTTYSVTEAVKKIENSDLDLQLEQKEEDVSLSSAAMKYMGSFNELEDISEAEADYQDKVQVWQREYGAYETTYQYIKQQKALTLQRENFTIAQQEKEAIDEKYKEGLVSQADVLRASMSIKNAELSLQLAKQQVDQKKYEFNQKIGKSIEEDFSISTIPSFKRLSRSAYDPKPLAEELKRKHESLFPLKTAVDTYDDILDDVDNLPVLGGDGYETSIENFKTEIEDLSQEIKIVEDKIKSETNPVEVEKLEKELDELKRDKITAEVSLDVKEEQYSEARSERSKAENDLDDYYELEVEKADIRHLKQQRQIELKVYNYAHQFDYLHAQLDVLQENVENEELFYEQEKERFELGYISQQELEKARINVLNAKKELSAAEIDYRLLKKKFELFIDGWM
ncbi:TolC family protein [Bacillus solimangrovi]|nr:TolC family protein [Bacillus solimangrovi]